MSTMAPVATGARVERMDWASYRRWLGRNVRAGEHGFIVGSTGDGKTVLAREVVPLFGRNIVVLDGKGGDDPSLRWPGFRLLRKWPPPEEGFDLGRLVTGRERGPIRVIVTRRVRTPDDLPAMRDLFESVLRDLFPRKGRRVFALFVDEAQIVSDPIEGMGLKRYIGPLIRVKRYDGMSVIQATQWPTWIGPSSSREATHRWAFAIDSIEEQRELAKKFGEDHRTFLPLLQSLARHEFIYKHKITRRLIVSKVKR